MLFPFFVLVDLKNNLRMIFYKINDRPKTSFLIIHKKWNIEYKEDADEIEIHGEVVYVLLNSLYPAVFRNIKLSEVKQCIGFLLNVL